MKIKPDTLQKILCIPIFLSSVGLCACVKANRKAGWRPRKGIKGVEEEAGK